MKTLLAMNELDYFTKQIATMNEKAAIVAWKSLTVLLHKLETTKVKDTLK